VSQHPDHCGIRVAWLTKHDITASEDILAFPAHLQPVQVGYDGSTIAEMGRGAVAITVQPGGGSPVVWSRPI
jgi:hypothetical protein